MEHEVSRAQAEHITLPVDSKNPLVMYANIFRLAKIIRNNSVDIVHARSRAPAWSAWLAAKRCNVPFVTTFHGVYSLGGRLKRRYNAVMTRGKKVIANSTFVAGHIRKNYGIRALFDDRFIHFREVVHNPLDDYWWPGGVRSRKNSLIKPLLEARSVRM